MGNGLNNPFSNAINSLLGNVGGLFTGTNPLTQPQVGQLFGFNIQGTPLVSTRDYFLTQLESWVTSIPLQSQWVILIQSFPSCINTDILQGLERTGGNYNNYNINQAKNLLISHPFQKVNGCLFAQSVDIPEEKMQTKNVNISNSRGFLPGVLSDGRQISNTLTIEFLETNTSFTDFVIRPWVIAGEHFGFVARENDTVRKKDPRNVKSTMYIMEYTRTFQHVSMIPRKVWTFFNCAPTSVSRRALKYDEPNSAPTMSTTWTYTDYTVSNSLYLPLPNIIDRVSSAFSGSFPTISPLQNKGIGNFAQNISGFF